MKIARFRFSDDRERLGLVEGDTITEVEGDIYEALRPTNIRHSTAAVTLLPPVWPSKVLLFSANYPVVIDEYKHGEKPAEPILFLKPPTAVVATGEPIFYPAASKQLTYEPELAFVIKRRAHRVPTERAAEHILGYTCINDVSARDIQDREVHMTRAKSFDTFCPLGPSIVTDLDPADLQISAFLNGARRVTTSSREMYFKVTELLSFASHIMTLMPGDVISTGAAWVEKMEVGDTVTIEIEGIGELSNPVVAEEDSHRVGS